MHEIAHKKHWDPVKRSYKANKSKYNCIEDAKQKADAKNRNYIIKQGKFYLSANISMYASSSFELAKHTNSAINEIIAEALAQDLISDPFLHELIKEELN